MESVGKISFPGDARYCIGWGPEQPAMVGGSHAHGMEMELGGL